MSEQGIPSWGENWADRLPAPPRFWHAWAEELCRARTELILWAPVALGLGIGFYFIIPNEPGISIISGCIVALVLAMAGWVRAPEPMRFPAALIALCLLGFMLALARAHMVSAPVLPFRYYGPIEGRVTEIDRSAKDKIRITLDQVRLSRVDAQNTPEKIRISVPGTDAPQPGYRVMTTGHLQPPASATEPGAWDFRRMAWFQSLGAVGYTRVPVLIVAPPKPQQWSLAGDRLRMALSRGMQAQMPGQAGAVAAALMTGDRSGIATSTNDIMRASGLYHIVSISGLHMGMLAGFVFGAVRYGLALCGSFALYWSTKKIAAVIALIAASIYLWVAGPEVATERSYIMVAVMLLAVLFDRRALSLHTVALAAILVLLMRPESLTEPGFQMSFAATIGLILSLEPWTQASSHLPRWIRPTIALALTSVIATIATSPISAAQFGQASVYGVLANMLVVPVMGVLVMPAGVIAAVLAPMGLEYPALWVMDMGTRWMILVADYVSRLEGATVILASPPAFALPVIGFGACLMILSRAWIRWTGAAMVILSACLWFSAPRPEILISSDAQVVGVMQPGGRVLSRSGNTYSSAAWLRADGENVTPQQAAERPGFSGENGQSVLRWNGRDVVHLTGRATSMVNDYCRNDAIVIVAKAVSGHHSCDLWDLSRLRQTGSVAYESDGSVSMVNDTSRGMRPWTN